MCLRQDVCSLLLDDLAKTGTQPTESTYSMLIRAAASVDDVSTALKFLAATKAGGLEPRLRSYSPILVALARLATSDRSAAGSHGDDTTAVAADGAVAAVDASGAPTDAASGTTAPTPSTTHAPSAAATTQFQSRLVPQLEGVASPPAVSADTVDELMETLWEEVKAAGLQPTEVEFTAMVAGYAGSGRRDGVLASLLPDAMDTVFRWSADSVASLQRSFAR